MASKRLSTASKRRSISTRMALDQLALVLELFLYPHHALAQLDLVDGDRLAHGLLGEPLAEVVLDELDVFGGEGHGSG